MGKSPGRWIKAVLFGKKHSLSRQIKNATSDKRASLRTTDEDPVENSLFISAPRQLNENRPSNAALDNGEPAAFSHTASVVIQSSETQMSPLPPSDTEMQRQNQAAATAQAAFKGYVARRAFRALKGIIKLQSLIRGHLVRRQAIATMYCMYAIVKVQAVVRGRNARLSCAIDKEFKKYKVRELQANIGEKLSFNKRIMARNSYISKLLGSVTTSVPLSLQYEMSAPNSSLKWLDRWSGSRFWAPPARPRKVSRVTAHRRQSSREILENDTVKSKRTFRRAENGQNYDNSVFSSLEMDVKRSVKRSYNHQADDAESELERIKNNLRKITETVTEKPQQQSSAKKASEPVEDAEEFMNQVIKAKGNQAAKMDEVDNINSSPYEERTPKEVEKQKGRDRRIVAAKPEVIETTAQNTPPSLPSYMAATESAKAKLRASSGSSKVKEEGVGFGHVRRHSLPSSLSGKFTTSLSPRIQQPNGKGSNKSNRLMVSSRDEKTLQPGWKR